LIGETHAKIRAWARGKLNGEEPDLKAKVLRKISAGELREVVLRPKRKGFFLQDGTFVEAFDYSPMFGEDLDEAEKRWDEEERVKEWVDAENQRFNRKTVEGSQTYLRVMWEHGKRVVQFSDETATPIFRLQQTLADRGGEDGYSLQTHQFCTDFFRWLPSVAANDPVFGWSWELTDALLRFSRDNTVRNHVKETVIAQLASRFSQRDIVRLLGTKGRDYYPEDDDLTEAGTTAIKAARSCLRAREALDVDQIDLLVQALRKGDHSLAER
jgi:hypothetical protein